MSFIINIDKIEYIQSNTDGSISLYLTYDNMTRTDETINIMGGRVNGIITSLINPSNLIEIKGFNIDDLINNLNNYKNNVILTEEHNDKLRVKRKIYFIKE
jgi:hypothetical protein